MKQLNMAFFGAGMVANLHAEAVNRSQRTRLIGLWNRTKDRAIQKATMFECKQYDDVATLLADPEIDAISILTNLESHHSLALKAIEAGKHVLIEKPVGLTVSEIENIRDAAYKKGVVCMPGHNYIYEDSIQRSNELISTGKLGKIASIYILYNIHHSEEVAKLFPGVIRQILTHHSYILLYLAGKPVEISAMKSVIHYENIPQEDLAMVNIRMQSGALAHFSASFAADDHSSDPWTVLIKVIGTEGATKYSYRDWVENKAADAHSQTYSSYPYTIYNEVNHFAEYIQGAGPEPLSTLDDAIDAQKIVEATEKSAQEQKSIFLSLD